LLSNSAVSLPEAAENSKKNPPGFIRVAGVRRRRNCPVYFQIASGGLPFAAARIVETAQTAVSSPLLQVWPVYGFGCRREDFLDHRGGCSLDDVETPMNRRVADAPSPAAW